MSESRSDDRSLHKGSPWSVNPKMPDCWKDLEKYSVDLNYLASTPLQGEVKANRIYINTNVNAYCLKLFILFAPNKVWNECLYARLKKVITFSQSKNRIWLPDEFTTITHLPFYRAKYITYVSKMVSPKWPRPNIALS